MNLKTNWKILVMAVALSLASVNVPAWAKDSHSPQGQAPRGGLSESVLEQLLAPCHAACELDAHDCKASAEEAAVTAIQQPDPAGCTNEVKAAQTACKGNEHAPACATALATLQTCSQAEVTALQAALGTCKTNFTSCVATCKSNATP